MADFHRFSRLAPWLQLLQRRRSTAQRISRSKTMNIISIGLARTLVVVVSTLVCGSSLMMAALGPGLAQAQTHQVAAPRA
jgi:hypothetical protein